MRHVVMRPWVVLGLAVLLAGCGSSTTSGSPSTTSTHPTGANRTNLPANSPLTTCVDETPTKVRSLKGDLAADFADGRVVHPVRLDGGKFEAVPPAPSAKPTISRAEAYCNLLAGVNESNSDFATSAAKSGMAFGLTQLTVDPSLQTEGQPYSAVGPDGQPQAAPAAHLTPYHDRLAWIAVFTTDDLATSCPAMPAAPSTAPSAPPTTAPNGGASYQIMAIDAATGANGILYLTSTASPCGVPGTRPASYQPAKIEVSLPWKMVKRGPGPSYATIRYEARPCDDRSMPSDMATNVETVFADRDRPDLVDVTLQRTLTTCGPATEVEVPLRSALPKDPLPTKLIHAPVGAVDTPAAAR